MFDYIYMYKMYILCIYVYKYIYMYINIYMYIKIYTYIYMEVTQENWVIYQSG